MDCPKCRGTIEDDSTYCKHCGARVREPEAADRPASSPKSPFSLDESVDLAKKVYHDPKYERQVWEGRPAWRSYYGVWAVWVLSSAAAVGAAYKWRESGSPVVTLVWLFVLGAAVAIWVREALFVFSLRYRLTTQRLFIHRGILTRVTDQMELIRVNDVRLRQGVVDRLVNTGDVEVMGTDETHDVITLQSVSAPAEVTEALRMHVRGARGKGALLIEQI
jgi:membrane protein YdbS with pleckstrin-like domain